ncbi:CLUMA_CG008134, isoform A [Clunio marinus]|uniref:CLUMA_CG008134, isoform A n=1 Tax=Clunio marinus TaxID=568069 RepID=A0A1J1I4E8_9DIPT|nr:CLUMA_CG008134, isoform A [Clunio marinus]
MSNNDCKRINNFHQAILDKRDEIGKKYRKKLNIMIKRLKRGEKSETDKEIRKSLSKLKSIVLGKNIESILKGVSLNDLNNIEKTFEKLFITYVDYNIDLTLEDSQDENSLNTNASSNSKSQDTSLETIQCVCESLDIFNHFPEKEFLYETPKRITERSDSDGPFRNLRSKSMANDEGPFQRGKPSPIKIKKETKD